MDLFEIKFGGNDNDGNPKQEYINRVKAMTAEEFLKECEEKIWLSSYAANNIHSDYHWQCDYCYYESVERDGKEATTYKKAYRAISKQLGFG